MTDSFKTKLSKFVDNKNLIPYKDTNTALSSLFNYLINGGNCINIGDEVLVTPLESEEVLETIVKCNLKIKWVDVSPIALMDLNDLRRKLTKYTRIVILTYYGGYPITHESIDQIKKECYDLFNFTPIFIESCHSLGTKQIEKAENFNPKKPVYKNSYVLSKYCKNICLTTLNNTNNTSNYNNNKLVSCAVLSFPESLNKYYDDILNNTLTSENYYNVPELLPLLDNINHKINRQIENAKGITFGLKDNKTVMPLRSMFEGCSYSFYCLDFKSPNKNDKYNSLDDFVNYLNDRCIYTFKLNRRDKFDRFDHFKCILPGLDTLEQYLIIIPCDHRYNDDDIKQINKVIKEFTELANEELEEEII